MESSKDRLEGDQKLLEELVKDGISIQSCFKPEPNLRNTGKGYFKSNIIEELNRIKRRKK